MTLDSLVISTLSFLLLGMVNARPSASSIDESMTQCVETKVLILGAGMAGISAGKALTEQGIHDFRIIEHQDRIGGRTIHTNFGTKPDGSSYTVELGTNWITGIHPPSSRNKGMGRYYDQNGRSNWDNVYGAFDKAYGRMVKDANNRVKRGKPDSSVSIGLALAGWDSTNDMRKQAAEVLEWDLDAAAPPDLSSLIFGQLSDDASELLGPDERFVIDQRGFDIVTRHLASEYLKEGDQRLVLDSPVTRITYSNDSVTAHTANNTCYHGDYAICTFSLGVLQQAINSQALVQFQPAFPAWKKEAILGNIMGIYTKIFFQFDHDKVFWPRKVKNFYYASPTTRGYWLLWESLDFPGSPLEGSGIIFATMVWDQSRRIEQQSDEATKQEGLAVLRQMFPKATVPEPQAFLYPRWGTTSWAFGSYSNWAAGYTLKQHTNFRANLGRLWFAGEATSVEYFGYLHGAFYEGKSAAEEIAACVAGQTCIDRKQYADLQGEPERNYNSTSGFQNPISQVLGAY